MTWLLSNHESRNPVFILLKILQIFFLIQKRPSLFAVFTSDSLNLHYATDRSKTVPVSGLPAFLANRYNALVHFNEEKKKKVKQLPNLPVKQS